MRYQSTGARQNEIYLLNFRHSIENRSKANARMTESSSSNLVFQNNVEYAGGHNRLTSAWSRDLVPILLPEGTAAHTSLREASSAANMPRDVRVEE